MNGLVCERHQTGKPESTEHVGGQGGGITGGRGGGGGGDGGML